jgi:hypothetical protein
VINRRGPLAEQDMVPTGGETRHAGGAEPAHRGETEQVPVKGSASSRLLTGIDQCVTPSTCKRLISFSFFPLWLALWRGLRP